ncbi:hypothetical protein Bca4012_011512 [Brassica carinata]
MNSSSQTTGRSTTISETENDSSCCIIQIENPIYSPKRLKKSAGGQSCCIFRIPHTLFQANETAYKPKIVSIGPYHHCDNEVDKDHLQMIQEHKQRYLAFFLSKTNKKDVHMTHLREVVSVMEERIRDSYSEDLKFDREKLIDMMVLDGCFILTLLIVVAKKSTWRINYADDPIFTLRWILPTLRSDLLLLENQVPFFVLQDLLKASRLFPSSSLNEMIFAFFSYSIRRPKEFWEERKNLDASHLLDLIRKTYVPYVTQQTQEKICTNIFCCSRENTWFNILSRTKKNVQAEPPSLIGSARKLQLRGIQFKQKEKIGTPLDITLKSGVLEIPKLTFDDFFSSLLINCVAFEQFSMKCSTEMTSYVTFMGCLINTEEDATFLSEKGIIENYFGTGEQVSLFFKNTGKNVAFSISKSFLSSVFEGVNDYTSQGYHVQWAGFKYTHFNSPWAFLSSCAALILLMLTMLQAFFTAYPYFRPPK